MKILGGHSQTSETREKISRTLSENGVKVLKNVII